MTTTFTATAMPGSQRVDLRLITDTLGAQTVSVKRTLQGSSAIARGGDGADISSGFWVMSDYEILYQTPIVYEAKIYDSAGTLLEVVLAPAVTVAEDNIWLRDVLKPIASLPVRVVGMEASDSTSEMRQNFFRPLGRPNPVVLSDVRSGDSGTTSVLAMTFAEQRSLRALLSSGHVLLLTAPADYEATWPLYISVGQVAVEKVGEAYTQARLMSFQWVQVDPPPGVVLPDVTLWGELLDAGYIWDDIDTTAWLDVLYPPGGVLP